MGNNSSTSSRRSSVTRELEKYTKPTGLYPTCPWEQKAARRMIIDRKIAPRFPGREAKESCFTQECPICFMYYPGNLNVSTCCKKPICSECFLQMKPPKKMICCPFCNRDTFGIKYTAPAVIELSSIYSDQTPTLSSVAKPDPVIRDDRTLSQHYASVEDRQKLRDDLRSQLNIAEGPITTPLPTSMVTIEDALMNASPADASRLEELMIMEAIRRSMHDANVAKDTSSSTPRPSQQEHHGMMDDAISEEDYSSDSQVVTPSHIHLDETRYTSSVRRSSNPFDDDFEAPGESDELPTPSSSSRSGNSDWNPFNA
ncbi:hypothetical protein FI667_g10570, partial [Globisporangium splendens]